VTLEVLRQHLEDFGWTDYELQDEAGEKEGLILTGYRDMYGKGHRIVIDPVVEKGVLLMLAPGLVEVPAAATPPERINELMLAALSINARSTLAWLSYVPDPGLVSVHVAMPIEENDISFEQFQRCLKALMFTISAYQDDFEDILAGKKKAADVLTSGMPLPRPEDIEQLRRMLDELEEQVRRSQQPGEDSEDSEQ
jgi:hypothetical protein